MLCIFEKKLQLVSRADNLVDCTLARSFLVIDISMNYRYTRIWEKNGEGIIKLLYGSAAKRRVERGLVGSSVVQEPFNG